MDCRPRDTEETEPKSGPLGLARTEGKRKTGLLVGQHCQPGRSNVQEAPCRESEDYHCVVMAKADRCSLFSLDIEIPNDSTYNDVQLSIYMI